MTDHDQCIQELDYQVSSNRSLVYILSFEEHRILEAIKTLCFAKKKTWTYIKWDLAAGTQSNNSAYDSKILDQSEILAWFLDEKVENNNYLILVLSDFYKFLAPEGSPGQIENLVCRQLYNLVEECSAQRKAIIITGAKYFLPIELEKHCALIDWPLPEKSIIKNKILNLLDEVKKRSDLSFNTDYSNNDLEEIVRSYSGLTLHEIELLTTYFVLTKDQLFPGSIAAKKQDIIRKNGLLEWINLNEGFDGVGGLDELKFWLFKRKDAFSDDAIEYGLPANPKGILLVGCQGAGKSCAAKAIAYFWKLPLVRLDLGKIFSGLVGSSEENMRSVIKIVESISPAVLWIDEIDKGLGNLNGVSDGGTSARVFASLLTWMQEKTHPIFVVATANDVSFLPPELLRKGRFDEIFFVDLPSMSERVDIFKIHLKKSKQPTDNFDIQLLAERTGGYTGAEIEAAIISAMYESFSVSKRPLDTLDIIKAVEETVPLSIVMKEKIDSLRAWAYGRARNASTKNDASVNMLYDNQISITLDEEL